MIFLFRHWMLAYSIWSYLMLRTHFGLRINTHPNLQDDMHQISSRLLCLFMQSLSISDLFFFLSRSLLILTCLSMDFPWSLTCHLPPLTFCHAHSHSHTRLCEDAVAFPMFFFFFSSFPITGSTFYWNMNSQFALWQPPPDHMSRGETPPSSHRGLASNLFSSNQLSEQRLVSVAHHVIVWG